MDHKTKSVGNQKQGWSTTYGIYMWINSNSLTQTFHHPSNPIAYISKFTNSIKTNKKAPESKSHLFRSILFGDEYLALLRSAICDLIEKQGIWRRPIFPRPDPVRRQTLRRRKWRWVLVFAGNRDGGPSQTGQLWRGEIELGEVETSEWVVKGRGLFKMEFRGWGWRRGQKPFHGFSVSLWMCKNKVVGKEKKLERER